MSPEDFNYYWEHRNSVMVRTLTNRIYQQERQRKMEFREAAIKVVSLVSGSAAFATLPSIASTTLGPHIPAVAGAIVVLATTCSMVFGFAAKARDAAKRATEWAMLDRDIHAVGPQDFTAQQVNSWAARCSEIEAGEPAPNLLLFQRSYERACEAIGSTPSKVSGKLSRFMPVILIP